MYNNKIKTTIDDKLFYSDLSQILKGSAVAQ